MFHIFLKAIQKLLLVIPNSDILRNGFYTTLMLQYSPSLNSSPPLTPKFDKNYHPFPFINTP